MSNSSNGIGKLGSQLASKAPNAGSFMSNSVDDDDEAVELGADASSGKNIAESIKEAQRYWSSTPDGSIFWGTSNITDKIPAGLYKCAHRDDIGVCLQKLIIETDDLIVLPDMICNEVIDQIVRFWSDPVKDAMKSRGFLHKRGILMFGEPGSGKTCTIQVLIQMLIKSGGIAIYGEDPGILSGCLQMIRRIEPKRPLIVVLEDFDTLTDRERRENTWLSVLDGESQIENVVFLATTNYIDQLDKRFVDRPSRFDLIVPVPMPTAKARAAYLYKKESSLSSDELYEWTMASDGFSIAHLKEMILSVKCYGKSLDETVARLKSQKKREYNQEALERQAKGSSGIGFTGSHEGIERFSNKEAFDDFMEGLKDHTWYV